MLPPRKAQMPNENESGEQANGLNAAVKITCQDKALLNKIIAFLEVGFTCRPTSPKMYDEKLDKFFQYVAISPKEA